MKTLASCLLLLFLSASCRGVKSPDSALTVSGLKCEYLPNPIGLDVEHPRFSWTLLSNRRGTAQSAYRVLVSSDVDELTEGHGTHWDSGKVSSNRSTNIAYEGLPLQSNSSYHWRVLVWDTTLDTPVSSESASFHTGLFKPSDWTARWITTPATTTEAPLLRHEFQVAKPVERAHAFVTACGYYELFLNGHRVGDQVLDPAITDYRHTILYSTHDVTTLLREGSNVAGAMLGNGAYHMPKVADRFSFGGVGSSLGPPSFLMQLHITYSDGSHSTVTTDESWRYAPGPITFNTLHGGEDYDARRETPGWSSHGFSDRAWDAVVLAKNPGGVLASQLMPPIRVTATVQPVARANPEPGLYLFDLGQNIAGWWRVRVKGDRGRVIRVRGAETLNDELFSGPLQEGDGLSTKFDYHAQVWTDYTLKGGEAEVYEPRFFYTGYRYVEVVADGRRNLESLEVEGRVVRTSVERNGTFASSEDLLNRIHRAGLWSQMGNTLGYPTDCPHREKGAYNGDGQVMAETSMHDFHMAPLYTKWLNDMRDAQEDDGRIPNTSPTLVGGDGGGVAWGSAYILLPWWMYHYYNDTRVLKQHYPGMKRYIQHLTELATKDERPEEAHIINRFGGYWYSLGEWNAPGEGDGPNRAVVNTFYYYYDVLILSRIAHTLGRASDARMYSELASTIALEFNRKFFNQDTSLYGSDDAYQTYQLLPLLGDLVPEGHRDDVVKALVLDIGERNGHLNTGMIGTKYLWPVLVREGYGHLAFEAATKTTYPSYGHWLENGATTLLENWTMGWSHNHQYLGSITEYFYKYLAGIQSPMEGKTGIGYGSIHLEPFVPSGLRSVEGTLETAVGTIVSSWVKEEDAFVYGVSIPANAQATIALPVFDFENVTVLEGGARIWDDGGYVGGVLGVLGAEAGVERIRVRVGSGDYEFRVSGDARGEGPGRGQ